MENSANRFLLGVAAALALSTTNASAQDYGPPRSVAEAHAFLGSLFQRYSIGYIAWHARPTRNNDQGGARFYGGRDCYSEVGGEGGGRAFAIDWSMISQVQRSGADAIFVMGQLAPVQNAGGWRYTNLHLYMPDAAVARSAYHALETLRGACKQRSRFD